MAEAAKTSGDEDSARIYWQRAAVGGLARAQIEISVLHLAEIDATIESSMIQRRSLNSREVDRLRAILLEAYQFLVVQVKAGETSAMCVLGQLYAQREWYGRRELIDFQISNDYTPRVLYQMAADKLDSNGMFLLGFTLLDEDSQSDQEKGLEYIKRAASNDHPRAIEYLNKSVEEETN